MVDDIRVLVEQESPSEDHEALRRCADTVRRLIRDRLGQDADLIVSRGITHVRRRPAPARILMLCHHDTVWPVGTLKRIPFTATDGVIRGPGCYDMKAGIVMGIHALALLREHVGAHIADQVELLITGDEERGSATSRSIISEDAAGLDAVLVLEAAADGGAVKVARKGTSAYVVDVIGRASHAGLEPEKGVNAGLELAHVVLAVNRLGDPAMQTTVTPTVMTAGTTSNTVPANAQLHVDVRAWTTSEQHRVDHDLRRIRSVVPGARVVVGGGPDRPPLELEASSALYSRWAYAASRCGIEALPGAAVGGASDGNITAGLGIPTLDGLGAVGDGAHAEHEHIEIAQLPLRTAALAWLLADLLGVDTHNTPFEIVSLEP